MTDPDPGGPKTYGSGKLIVLIDYRKIIGGTTAIVV
jgi:hypothetical protein